MNVINSKNNKSYKYYSEDELIGHKRKRIDYEDSSSPSILSSERNIISSLQHCVTSSKDTEIQEEEKQHRQKQQNQQSKEICYIDQIPKELFFKIISFIGPASSSLVVLTQINKRYATIMKQVGHSMLERSKTCYKTHLPKIYMNESLLSLCTRHVQCFQFVIEKCNVLKEFLEKDFVQGCFMDAWKRGWIDLDALNEMNSCYMKTETTTQDSGMDVECKLHHQQQQQQHHHHQQSDDGRDTITTQQQQQQRRNKVPSTITEIDQAMDIVLDLLGKDNISYFLDHRNDIPIQALHPSLSIHGRKNILEYFTTKMERQILILCGKCGGMVFKYIKMMSLLQSQQQLQQTHQQQQVLYNRQNRLVLESVHQWKDEERLDRARLIMQLVIYRLMLVEKNDMDVPTSDDFISSSSSAVAAASSSSSSSSSTSSSSVSSSNEGNNSTIPEDDESSTLSDFDDDGNSNDNYKSVEEEPFYTWLEG